MKSGKVWGWILLFFTLSCIFCGLSAAQTLAVTSISVSPTEVWLNKNPNLVTITARCEYGGSLASNADMWAKVTFPRSGGTSTSISRGGSYEYRLYASFPETGVYTVTVYCSYAGQTASASSTFAAHNLELTADYDKEIETYLGDMMELDVKFKLDGSLITPKKDTFSVYLGLDDRWERLEQTEDPILSGTTQKIKVKIPLYSSRIMKGLYDLRVEGRSGDEVITLEKMKLVWVNEPLEIYLQGNEIVHVVGSESKRNISAKVVFKAGDLWDLDVENAEVRVYNEDQSKDIPLQGMYCDRTTSVCIFSVELPALTPGEYSLEVTVAYPSIVSVRYSASDTIPLKEVLSVSGSVRDAKGKVISTTITVESIDRGDMQTITTSSTGNYSLRLLPGRYNFVFRFSGGAVVSVYNVSISKAELMSLPGELIRYDEGHMSSAVPDGMRLLKVVVLELALPFSNIQVYMPYDSSRVTGDEKKLKAYFCDRWNFERSICSGSWTTIEEVSVQTIKDAVEFNTTSYGAFMLGENDRLSFSSTRLMDSLVFMRGPVEMAGVVLNSKKEPVHGAVVTASFPKYGLSSSTTTSIDGEFKVGVNAPEIEGEADVLLSVEKDLYIGANTSYRVTVSRKKELSILNVPDIVPVTMDEINDIEFKLFNSGQLDIEDSIYIHVAGISSDWYELLPTYVSSLKVGEEKSVVLRIRLNNELCGGKCNKFYLVNLEAKSKNFSRTASFTLRLPVTPINESESPAESPSSDLTGFSLAFPSMSSPYIPLTIIVVLLFLIVNKKKTSTPSFGKKHKHGQTLRASIMSSFSRLRR